MVAASELEASAMASALHTAPPSEAWSPSPVFAHTDLLVSGVGKASAAGAVAAAIARHPPRMVLSVGIAGILPGDSLALGDVARISAAVLADEGVATPGGFTDVAAMGFPPVPGLGVRFDADRRALGLLAPFVPQERTIATVSTCSGTDDRARDIAVRTAAALEDMETAAIAQTCVRLGIPWCGIRAASNTTGDRASQRWNVAGALDALARVIGPALDALTPNDL